MGIVIHIDGAAVNHHICACCGGPNGDRAVVFFIAGILVSDGGVVDFNLCSCASYVHNCQTGQVGVVDAQVHCACGGCNHDCIVVCGCGDIIHSHLCGFVDNVDRTLAGSNSKVLDLNFALGIDIDCAACGGGQLLAIAVQSDGLVNGQNGGQGNIFQQGDGFASICCCVSCCEGCVVSAVALGLCVLDDALQDLALDLRFLSMVDGQGDIISGNAGGSSVNFQSQSTVVGDIGSGLVMDGNIAYNITVNQGQRSTVGALDPQLDTLLAAGEGAVGSGAAGSGDVHSDADSINGNILHGADDGLGCVAAVGGLDTIGNALSCSAVNVDLLDFINTCSILLNNDTANSIAGGAGAGHIDIQIGDLSSVPDLDGSNGAGMVQFTIGNNDAVILQGQAIVSCAGGQSVTAQIQGDRLGDLQMIGSVVDISSQADNIAVLCLCNRIIQLSFSCDFVYRQCMDTVGAVSLLGNLAIRSQACGNILGEGAASDLHYVIISNIHIIAAFGRGITVIIVERDIVYDTTAVDDDDRGVSIRANTASVLLTNVMANSTAVHGQLGIAVGIDRHIALIVFAPDTGIAANCTAIDSTFGVNNANCSTIGIHTSSILDLATVHNELCIGINSENTMVATNVVTINDCTLVHGQGRASTVNGHQQTAV